jgi:hypothetical protein
MSRLEEPDEIGNPEQAGLFGALRVSVHAHRFADDLRQHSRFARIGGVSSQDRPGLNPRLRFLDNGLPWQK